jgi:hypothetical protein
MANRMAVSIGMATLVALGHGCGRAPVPTDGGSDQSSGTLIVSTSTKGADPAHQAYLLTIDGLDSLPLHSIGTSRIDVASGQHTLALLGAEKGCAVTPGAPLQIDVPAKGTIAVAFDISCPAVQVTTKTTGLDLDPDGYRVLVNGTDKGGIASNGTLSTRLAPGTWTILLTDLTPNCTIDGPASHDVTVVDSEVVSIQFSATCTATTGVIAASVTPSGPVVSDSFQASLDGGKPFFVRMDGPEYLNNVAAGDHVISLLSSARCSAKTDSQPARITVGTLVRDSVGVDFPVTCRLPPGTSATVRVTADISGRPTVQYTVWAYQFAKWDYGRTRTLLGSLDSTGTLVVNVEASRQSGADPYYYFIGVFDPIRACEVQMPGDFPYTIQTGDTLHVDFVSIC